MNRDWLLRRMRRQARTQRSLLMAVTGTFLALAVLTGSAVLLMRSTHHWIEALGQNVHVIAFLHDETDEPRAAELATLLRRLPHVAEVRVVEPAEALKRLRDAAQPLTGTGVSLDGVEPGYLPRSLEIRLQPDARVTMQAQELARHLELVPGVSDVDAVGEGLVRVQTWVELSGRVSWALVMATLLTGAGLLALLLLRGRETRRREAQVLSLLGETPAGIRLPAGLSLAAGALAGTGAGLGALSILWSPLARWLARGLGLAESPVRFFGPFELTVGLGLALLVGWLLGHFSTPLPDGEDASC